MSIKFLYFVFCMVVGAVLGVTVGIGCLLSGIDVSVAVWIGVVVFLLLTLLF